MIAPSWLSVAPVAIFQSCHLILLFCHKMPPSVPSSAVTISPSRPVLDHGSLPLPCDIFDSVSLICFLCSLSHFIVVDISYSVVSWISRLCCPFFFLAPLTNSYLLAMTNCPQCQNPLASFSSVAYAGTAWKARWPLALLQAQVICLSSLHFSLWPFSRFTLANCPEQWLLILRLARCHDMDSSSAYCWRTDFPFAPPGSMCQLKWVCP